MTDIVDVTEVTTDPVDEVDAWLEENWDPELTVAEWWERLGLSGWAAPGLPRTPTALNRNDSVAVQNAIAEFGALGARAGSACCSRHRRSPPTARRSRSTPTSATSSPARRRGASCSASRAPAPTSPACRPRPSGRRRVDRQRAEGVDLRRPVRRHGHAHRPHRPRRAQAPGHHLLRLRHAPARRRDPAARGDDRPRHVQRGVPRGGPAPDSALIGDLNNGWAVANTTLMNERAGLGSGGGSAAAGAATPGTGEGPRRRVGDFVAGGGQAPRPRRLAAAACSARSYKLLIDLAKGNGKIEDPTVRQGLVQLHTIGELGRFNDLRGKAARRPASDIPGLPNISKLSMSEIVRSAARPRPADPGSATACSTPTSPRTAGPRRSHRQPVPRRGHGHVALRPGAADLRRHRPDPAQHHRRACARSPQGGQQRQDGRLQGPPEERLIG